MKKREESAPTNRRKFLGAVGGATAAAVVTNVVGLPALSVLTEPDSHAADIGPQGGRARAERSEEIRERVAEAESRVGIPHHRDNGDETRYANKIGNYSDALKHDPHTGEVDPTAYQALIGAISSGRFSDFEELVTNGHFGCGDPTHRSRVVLCTF